MPVSLPSLRETRAGLEAEQRGLLTRVAAGETLADNENIRLTALDGEIATVDTRIRAAERVANMERRAPAESLTRGGGEMDLRGYSPSRHVQGAISGKMDGLEAEVQQEMERHGEARSGAGILVRIPSHSIGIGVETRDGQTVGTPSAGGLLVPTTITAPAEMPRPLVVAQAMGATVFSGLTANLDSTYQTGGTSSYWLGENENTTRSAATFAKKTLAAKTISAEARLSRLTLTQTPALEEFLKRDIGFKLAQGVDFAAIAGTGTGNMPLGILNTAGVEAITPETMLYDTAADMIGALELDDITGTTGFLTNPTVAKLVRKLKDNDGYPLPEATIFHGKRVEYTTQVPKNLGEDEDKSALIYGLWSELIIGYWSSVDLLVNPYHPDVASNGGVLIHAFLNVDLVVRRPNAFVKAEL